jgi:hypothetical protein
MAIWKVSLLRTTEILHTKRKDLIHQMTYFAILVNILPSAILIGASFARYGGINPYMVGIGLLFCLGIVNPVLYKIYSWTDFDILDTLSFSILLDEPYYRNKDQFHSIVKQVEDSLIFKHLKINRSFEACKFGPTKEIFHLPAHGLALIVRYDSKSQDPKYIVRIMLGKVAETPLQSQMKLIEDIKSRLSELSISLG